MTPTSKKVVGLIAAIVVLFLVAFAWHFTHLPKNPLVPSANGGGYHITTQSVGDFDQFQRDLAARVLKQYDGGKDFSVIVATTAYPLGTLLRSTGSVPADLEDCAPKPSPTPFAAQHLFPSYTMSSDTALAANLGSGALQGLDSAGANLKQSQIVQYTIADAQIQIMDDKSVEQVTGQGNCGKYISGHPGMRLIRGTVLGKMTFTVKVDNPATVKAQLAKIGGFSISDNPGSSTVSVADNERQPIVELLSEFDNGPTASIVHPTPKPVEASAVFDRSPASVESQLLHMYVQMDVQDSPASGAKVVQLLRAGWPSANIESKVQKIPSQKMPDTAQVRYFNESDLAIANRCLEILRKTYPDARVVRIGLPSPKGQLEVWLPKVSSPTSEPAKPDKSTQASIPRKRNNNTANPGTVAGHVDVKPCGVFQNGGSNNTATTNCVPDVKITASAQTQGQTGNPEMPWMTFFTISTNMLVQTGNLKLKCDGPVLKAGIGRINPASLITGNNGPSSSDPNEAIYELGPEMLSPGKIVTVDVYSKLPVTVLSGSLGQQKIIFPPQ